MFWYYGQADNPTKVITLSSIATQQATTTKSTLNMVHHFLDNCASQEVSVITYQANYMWLIVYSNVGYLNKKKHEEEPRGTIFSPIMAAIHNKAILNIAQIIKAVLSLVAETELGAAYINAHKTMAKRIILQELGHPQPAQSSENTIAKRVINNRVQPRQMKVKDMYFHWLRDCNASECQHFLVPIYWC